jgi:hypothetical protein
MTRIPTSLHTAIKRAAAEDKRTVSDWIMVTLQAVLAERDRERGQEQEPPEQALVSRRRRRASPKPAA